MADWVMDLSSSF